MSEIEIVMVFLVFWAGCAVTCAIVAGSKGLNAFGWFLVGLLIGIFGVIIVCAVPAKKPATD